MTIVVVATRSSHKLREIREILPPIGGLQLTDLAAAGVEHRDEEDEVEAFSTFEENALAKARYFGDRSGSIVLADDSGLCVDALEGAPGVRSRRYSGRDDLSGFDLDRANNETLLAALQGLPPEQRTARFYCAIAIVRPSGEENVVHGTIEGSILQEARGVGGFGYDPLFYVPELEGTLAEIPAAVKDAISHRAKAVLAALPHLRDLASQPLP